jgi:hypothetical protein
VAKIGLLPRPEGEESTAVFVVGGEAGTGLSATVGRSSALRFRTTFSAPNGRLIAVDTANSARSGWREIIPEAKDFRQTLAAVQSESQNVGTTAATVQPRFPVDPFSAAVTNEAG